MEPNDVVVYDDLTTLKNTKYNPPSVSPTSSASSSPTSTQPNIPNLEGVRIKIVEQPAMKGLRFRYICEGRSAGSIPGVHSTPENKTFPTIEIHGYEGKVKVVVSCVTKDEPYRPHPHNLVGKEGCEHGVCLATINGHPMRAVFSNLGIQCVKKKDIKSALEERERKRIDPFKSGFAHKDQPSSIDLNVIRLCFQAFIPIPGVRKPFPIHPVVSVPIFDKKSINDLVICRLCNCAAKVTGGDKIILLCEKVPKDDIKIRFFEVRNNELFWEDFGEFQQSDVHKQAAITFKTPRYINPDVNHKVRVYIQLYRPSDGETSEALPFEFYPDLDNIKRKRIKTDGNPMNLLREIQQIEQIQYNISNLTHAESSTMWNIQPAMQLSPSNITNLSEVKVEPVLSPYYCGGSYKNMYLTSLSPQLTSPLMNRNITTPAPDLIKNASTASQSQNQGEISRERYKNSTNDFNLSTSVNNEYKNMLTTSNTFKHRSSSNSNYNNIGSTQQQTQFTASNIYPNRTSGGSFTPIYSKDGAHTNTEKNTTFTQFQSMNITNSIQPAQAVPVTATNSMMFNQLQDSNTPADSSLFNLSQLDDLVPLQNSDELRISNLSISS